MAMTMVVAFSVLMTMAAAATAAAATTTMLMLIGSTHRSPWRITFGYICRYRQLTLLLPLELAGDALQACAQVPSASPKCKRANMRGFGGSTRPEPL